MRIHKQRGFTLVELLITVAVIVILIGITLVSYKEVAERAVDAKIKQEIVDLREALRLYHQKYQKMPNGSHDTINLCLISYDSSCQQAWRGWSGSDVASVLSELRKVGYNTTPTAFVRAPKGWNEHSSGSGPDHRYSYEQNPSYDYTPVYSGDNADVPSYWTEKIWNEDKLISAPMVRYNSDGSFYFLYFRDHRNRECPIGKAVTLQHYWRSNGTIEACASHPLDQLP